MNKIIWIIGESATGKETFIRYAITNPNCELIKQLGYNNGKIIPIFDVPDDERIKIKDMVLDLLNKETNATILIKWQAVDSLHRQYSDVLRKLATATPNIQSEIILLSVERAALWSRLQKKDWWADWCKKNNWTRDNVDKSAERIKNHARDLSNELGFKLTEIDATDGYELIKERV